MQKPPTTVVANVLAGGAVAEISIPWTVPSPIATHTLYALLDPADAINEADESNNLLTITAVTPDVAVSSIQSYYYPAHEAVPAAVIANNGPLTATNVTVEFRAETITGTVRYTTTIPSLAPNGSELVVITATIDVSTWAEGDYTHYVVVDGGNSIVEPDETDNIAPFVIKVRPDMVIYAGDVAVSGNDVTVTVRNWGTADASNVIITGYADTITGTVLFTDTLASLSVDGVVTNTYTIASQPTKIIVVADPEALIAEISRNNNTGIWLAP